METTITSHGLPHHYADPAAVHISHRRLFDAPGRSNFVPADQAFAFDFQQQQHDVNLSWQIKDGYYLYRQQFTFSAAGATIDEPALPAGEWHEDEFYGKSEIFRQRLTVPVTVKEADKDSHRHGRAAPMPDSVIRRRLK